MSIVTEVVGFVRGVIEAQQLAKMPPEIVVTHPVWSPGKGTEAGRFLLKRDEEGFSYAWHNTPLAPLSNPPAVAELETRHAFTSLESLAKHLKGSVLGGEEEMTAFRSVFIHGAPFQPMKAEALNELHPEYGATSLAFVRHPAWVRWAKVVGAGEARDLSHVDLADLLLDNREDLEVPEIAQVLSQFRASRTIEYDADLDRLGSMGVRLSWSGKAGAKTSEVEIPRDFAASFPAFVGAWAPGSEPKHEARFRLRVIPPKGDKADAAPLFRILWVNALDYEREAANALHAAVVTAVDPVSVFLGAPNVRRVVLP